MPPVHGPRPDRVGKAHSEPQRGSQAARTAFRGAGMPTFPAEPRVLSRRRRRDRIVMSPPARSMSVTFSPSASIFLMPV
jgi:hypothetical protein